MKENCAITAEVYFYSSIDRKTYFKRKGAWKQKTVKDMPLVASLLQDARVGHRSAVLKKGN